MKTKTLVKLLIAFSLLTAVSITIALACAGGDEYEFRYSDFAPEPHVDASYSPLFYSMYEMFYSVGYEGGYTDRFNEEILKDWKAYLSDKINETNLKFLLFDEKSVAVVGDLYSFVSKGTKTGSYNEWNGKINLSTNEVKSFIEFLYFAKEIEKSSVSTYDSWNYENAPKPPMVDQSIINQIKSKYQSVSNPFLKNRYWFQTIKAYFYSDAKQEANSFFEKTKSSVQKNTLYYRALSYMAGIAKKSKDYAQANYLYSIVFDKCPSMRTTAAYCFHPQSDNDWNAALALGKNAEEKAAMWALLGYYVDEVHAIDEIYKLNPKSIHLDYLLTRAINKAEDNFQNKVSNKDFAVVSTIAQAGNTSKPYLWNMAAGYFQCLDGNYTQARTFLDKAEKQLPSGQLYKDQLRLLKFVNKLSETKTMDASAEGNLLADLQWLYVQLPKSAPEKFRFQKAIDWSKARISELYKSQQNIVFAQLFNEQKEFYHDNMNIEAMKSFLEKGNKSEFEKLAAGIYPIIASDLYEFQSVMYMFENKTNEAYQYMQKAGGNNAFELLANPFNGLIKDCHDCEHAAVQKAKFSKLRFVEVMHMMQEKINKGEELFNNNLLMANGFYNMTFFGNARVFYEGKIIGKGISTFWMMDEYYKNDIFSMKNAKYYYEQALKAATTNEQKAKCCYMLAKCERNDYYSKNNMVGNGWNESKNPDYLAWDGFRRLKTQYSTTKYYKDVIAECGYFAKYIGK